MVDVLQCQPFMAGIADGRGGITVEHFGRYNTGNGVQLDDLLKQTPREPASIPPLLIAPNKHMADQAAHPYPDPAASRHHRPTQRPFEQRHGRKYARIDSGYPLPCDVQELNRQNLKTSLSCKVLGRAICAPLSSPPTRVLEIGCGSAYWTSRCHELFSSMGHGDILYTGLDIAPLAPDLKKHGLNWTFVQHDMRRFPWPFEDESFDFIMCKDVSLAISESQLLMDECIRLLEAGGTLEIWEADHTTRAILPHQPSRRPIEWEQRLADKTGIFPMSPATPFAPTQNRFLKSANAWIDKALEIRELSATPCARVTPMLLQEPDKLVDVGFRRIAIPLSELEWEQEMRRDQKARSRTRAPRLTAEQLSIRETAMLTVIQMVESLEPILKTASGKNSEEWSSWWSSMMTSLNSPGRSSLQGECLEIGAWWATKLVDDDDD